MNRAAQVWHVMKKDVRESWVILLAYLGVVVVATAAATGSFARINPLSNPMSLFLLIASMLVTAAIVQNDSPVTPRADWIGRPVHATSLLNAKVVLVVIAVLMPEMLGQLISLLYYGVPLSELSALLGESIPLATFGIVLGFTLGLVSGNYKTFVLALAGVFVVNALVSAVFKDASGVLNWLIEWRSIVLFTIGAAFVAAAVAVYRMRDIAGRSLVPASVLLFSPMASVFMTLSVLPAFTRDNRRDRELPRRALEIDSLFDDWKRIERTVSERSNPGNSSFDIQVAVRLRNDDGSARTMLALSNVSITDTAGLRGFAGVPTLSPLNNVHAIADGGNQWLGGSSPRLAINLTLPTKTAKLVHRGATVGLTGRAVVYQREVLVERELKVGTTFMFDGANVVVTGVNFDSLFTMEFQCRGVIRVAPGDPRPDSTEYVLVNHVRNESLLLKAQFFGRKGGGNPLVVAGPVLADVKLKLSSFGSEVNAASNIPRDPQWYREAKLVVVHWIPKYSYPVHAEYVLK